MIPRPFGCDGNDCDYDLGGWFHVDCALASGRGTAEIQHLPMRPTREHLAANPLPTKNRRVS